MRRLTSILMLLTAVMTVQAEDTVYPYLTFETADGGKVSVSVSATEWATVLSQVP